ncbi:MAG: choice-of-anchor D domain-containing protein [Clostridia bacterium]|nr:choice-of-anchor D domain-containing protein [Clostridia bacterium]
MLKSEKVSHLNNLTKTTNKKNTIFKLQNYIIMLKSVLNKMFSVLLMGVLSMVAISGGNVVGQNDAAPVIITNPNTLYFDDTYVASSSQKTLTIFNAGDANLVISQGIFDGPFETYNSFPITVAPGTAWNQVIHFKPFEVGLIQGTVTYVSNDPVTPNKVATLIGNCIDTPINGWEWIYTGFNYINMDIEFPEGQDQIGFIAGQSNTMNGIGIILKTLDGGDTWNQVSTAGIHGLTNCAFPTLQTGYAVGWDNSVLKTSNGGATWTETVVSNTIDYILSVDFKDASNGVIVGVANSGNAIAYATSNGGATWTPGTGNEAIEDVTYAGDNTYFSAGYEYVCKSTDGGLTWTTVYTQGALLTALDFFDTNYGIAAGDYGQVITTHNGGVSWEEDIIMDWLFHKPFIWDNDTAYVVGTPEYVYKTTDAGQNWLSDFEGNWMKAFYTITFTDNYTGFISGSGGIICRKKPAVTTAPIIGAAPNPLPFGNVTVGNSSTITLTITNTGDAPLVVSGITSTNPVFTVNMTSFTVAPGDFQNVAVTFQPTVAGNANGSLQIANNSAVNPYQVMVSGTGVAAGPAPVIILNPATLYFDDTYIGSRTQKTLTIFNAGTANLVISQGVFVGPWETYGSFPITIAPGTAYNQVIQFKPFELGLLEGSVTYTSNDPVNPTKTATLVGNCINDPINGWEWIYTGYNYILTDIEFPEGQDQIGYTGGQTVTYNGLGIMLKTTDGGDTWTPLTQPGIAGIERFSFPTLETGYAAGWTDNIMKTTNGGQTWQNLPVVSGVYYYACIEFKDENTGILIVNLNAGDPKILFTNDGGASWAEGTGNTAFMDVTWAGGSTWYATGWGDVCKSTDDGATWTNVYSQGALLIGADFLTPDYGIAAGDYGQVITTRNGGATWEEDAILDILFHKPFIWDEDTAYVVGTPEYIYKTTDGGVNWDSDFEGNWEKALYAVTFTDNYTGFVCGGSNGIVLRKKPGINPYLEPPTNLTAVVVTNDVTLNWTAPASKALIGYNVYRDGVKVNSSTVAATTYYDQDVAAGNHLYQVSAVYSQGQSSLTDFVEIFIEGETGKIQGFVRDAITNLSIANAHVTAINSDNGVVATVTPFGSHYSMLLPAGTYSLVGSAEGYQASAPVQLVVVTGQNIEHTFYLQPGQQETLTGIDKMGATPISISPNPATGRFKITSNGAGSMRIINQNGRLMMDTKISSNEQIIDVNQLPAGLYLVLITTPTGIKTEKLILE